MSPTPASPPLAPATAPATERTAGPAGQPAPERDRKAEHIRLALEQRMQLGANYFDDYHFEHAALPEIDFDAIDPGVDFLGQRLAAPLLISSMTGGTAAAALINRNLAAGAERMRHRGRPRLAAQGIGGSRVKLIRSRSARSRRRCRCSPTWGPCSSTTGSASANACRRWR